ncbi:hypothetical protein SELMODRAFT_19257, partial [Selaginella moellendorffii]
NHLYSGQFILSSNKKNILILESNCNLVLYSRSKMIWETKTGKNYLQICMLKLQNDGNLVLYSSLNSVEWSIN